MNHHVLGATITSESSVYCSGMQGCHLASITADDMIVCDGSWGCWYANINLGLNTVFKCTGWRGCQHSTIARQRGSVGSLMCDGYYACLFANISYTTDIECNGLSACYAAASIQTSNGDLYCDGLSSCAITIVAAGDLNKKNPSDRTSIYLGGMYAGYNAHSLSAERIYAYG